MRKKTTVTEQSEPDDKVKLKPLFGIKPGIYLTVLYSFIILLFLFWLFIYDGLVNYGTVLEIKTEPAGAAVRVNGVYLGNSGTRIPLPNIVNQDEPVNIEVVLPGFEAQGRSYKIPGKVFGTRFFPRIYKLEYTLQTIDPSAAFAQAAAEYAEWSFGGEPTEAWQIPLVLSEAAYRAGNSRGQISSDTLHAAARFATTRAAVRDLTRAKFLLDNNGNAPSPVSAIGSMADILVFLSENPESAEWLAGLLPPETAKTVKESNWYEKTKSARRVPFNLSFKPEEFGTRRLNLAGLSFTGTVDFLISETTVSKSLFETFLTDHPEWNEHYFDYFEEERTPHPTQIFGANTATGVSWYAAEAFCKWLESRLPASLRGMEVRLPKEEEWLFAHNYGIMWDNPGWEWCKDPFAPLNFPANNNAILAVGSPERTIYSGESYNPLFSTARPKPLSKASLPPDFCSPIVTFRVVIARLSD